MRVQMASDYEGVGGHNEVVELPDARAELLLREGWARIPDEETGIVAQTLPAPAPAETVAGPGQWHGKTLLDKISQAEAERAQQASETQPGPTAAGSHASVVAPGPEGGQGTQGAAQANAGSASGTGA